ncbi:hypothetical protein LP417_18030 [Polaromonas sp. P1-6]|nr:hypothetical protein LP417_18030 [Polaromonas sp. P1-6]
MQEHPNVTISRRHCMAAMLATSAAFMSGYATDVVYLDALLPENGQRLYDMVPPVPTEHEVALTHPRFGVGILGGLS